jgi:hypothetical protein
MTRSHSNALIFLQRVHTATTRQTWTKTIALIFNQEKKLKKKKEKTLAASTAALTDPGTRTR